MQFLSQPCFTYEKATLNTVKQAKEAQEHVGPALTRASHRLDNSTTCQNQRPSRAFCKVSELGMLMYQALPSVLSVLHQLCTHCMLELVAPQQQTMPSNTENKRSQTGDRHTNMWDHISCAWRNLTWNNPSHLARADKRRWCKASPMSSMPTTNGFRCSREGWGGHKGSSSKNEMLQGHYAEGRGDPGGEGFFNFSLSMKLVLLHG